LYKIPANTLFIGKHVVFVPECHSTNTLAIELSQSPSTPEGTVVITNNQTAGRGQRGNRWESAPGMNLTFSIVLKPFFLPVKDQFYLNIFVSLALRDFLSLKTEHPVCIKWPNDILVHDKKICGILIENQIRGSSFLTVVAGIGLNVNQTEFNAGSITSVGLVSGKQSNLSEAFEDLLGCLERRYLQLRQQKNTVLLDEYLSHLYWRKEKKMFLANNLQFEGRITSVDENGKLGIETVEGMKYFGVKEIVYLT
jgi:BirA family biotin operon repressor/biotin-[acetyl-CoA-carboxylase] ligase